MIVNWAAVPVTESRLFLSLRLDEKSLTRVRFKIFEPPRAHPRYAGSPFRNAWDMRRKSNEYIYIYILLTVSVPFRNKANHSVVRYDFIPVNSALCSLGHRFYSSNLSPNIKPLQAMHSYRKIKLIP